MELILKIPGQCPSGKNNIIITKTGKRFPNPRFKKWKDEVLPIVKSQIPKNHIPLDFPVNCTVIYAASNRIRRDIPGIMDALWHILEVSGVVSDDRYLGGDNTVTKFVNLGVESEGYVKVILDYGL